MPGRLVGHRRPNPIRPTRSIMPPTPTFPASLISPRRRNCNDSNSQQDSKPSSAQPPNPQRGQGGSGRDQRNRLHPSNLFAAFSSLAENDRVTRLFMMACALAGGLLAWHSLFEAGIHPALAGVATGLLAPVARSSGTGIKEASADTAPNRPEPTEHRPIEAGSAEFEPTGIGRSRNPTLSPAERLDRFLTPLSSLVVLPLFAFFSPSISLDQLGPGLLTDRVILGATLGLALLGVLAGRSCPCSSWPSALSLVGCGLPGASRPDYKTYPLSELSHASLGFRQNRSPTRLSYDGRA